MFLKDLNRPFRFQFLSVLSLLFNSKIYSRSFCAPCPEAQSFKIECHLIFDELIFETRLSM
jgi:hypothetical protein